MENLVIVQLYIDLFVLGWLDDVFFPSNKATLRRFADVCIDYLRDIEIEVLEPSAGLYVWANFSKVIITINVHNVSVFAIN